jgi:hypothetical protein
MDPELSRRRFERDVEPLLAPGVAGTGIRVVRFSPPTLIVGVAWPLIDEEMLLCIDGTDYDWSPIEGWWVTDGTGTVPRMQRIPNGGGFQAAANMYGDPRSWLCFRGWRAYHEHNGHHIDRWVIHRGDARYRVAALVHQLGADLRKQGVTVQ